MSKEKLEIVKDTNLEMPVFQFTSHYANYIKERDGKSVIENGHGFVVYKMFPNQKECYIEDMYVKPESRMKGIGKEFLDQVIKIAKAEGMAMVTSIIRPSQRSVAKGSMMAQLKVGFIIVAARNDEIIMAKEI